MKGEDNLQTQQLIGTASKSSLFGPVMNSLLTKLVRSKILASYFLAFLLTSTASREKNVNRQSYHPIGTVLYRLVVSGEEFCDKVEQV